MNEQLLRKMSNNLKFLSVDMVNAANSGHPGVAMGLSDVLAVLSTELNLDTSNHINRDRLIFSGGHASSLIYSFLHLCGFNLSLDDLKQFRRLGSLTAGHPEIKTHGVEIDTGPLGQGVANAVGFAMAAKYASKKLNNAIDHKVFCICGDGDLQEGISYEACSLANVHNLDNLILIYDSNDISIEGNIKNAFDDDMQLRFLSLGFNVLVIDGHDFVEIKNAIQSAKNALRPSIIIARTKIAKGALELEGSEKSHGAPLGAELALRAKKEAEWNEGEFYVDSDAKKGFSLMCEKSSKNFKDWDEEHKFNDEQKEFLAYLKGEKELNVDFSSLDLSKKYATRESNYECLNVIAKQIPTFLGGSADLAPSNKTTLNGFSDIRDGGKNIAFGIREHAMGAITNAFAKYGLHPFCATFLVFSDYLKPAIRLSALMSLKEFFIFTHDSIGVGEDGPTHQPIEHISTLRNIPNLNTFRPADMAENIACWQVALKTNKPSAFALSRSGLPSLNTIVPDISKGAYFVKLEANPEYTLIASGSEVSLALEVAKKLGEKGKKVSVLSMPCFELFDELFDKSELKGKVIGIEAARSYELYKYCDDVIMMNTFGASGAAKDVFEYFGFTADKIISKL